MPFGGYFHEFAFGLLYRNGDFYLNLSVSINYGGETTDPQPVGGRGTHIVVNRRSGQVTTVAGGLRTPNGIGWGSGDDLYVTDNQGGWLPASKLLKISQGAFYHHYTNPDGPFDAEPVTRPVLWLPQNQIANSPSTPVLLKSGPYKGQMLIGDVTYGGLQRAYLETVHGQEQGAVFRHTQGLEAGVNEVSIGPDGAIYLGGLGAEGNWGQEGKLRFGLQKLTPNGTDVFDMKTMKIAP
jgi:sugar lactone lactonase YvrE